MAETIQTSISLRVGGNLLTGAFTDSRTQSGNENFGGTQSIATSATQVDLGANASAGELFIKNTDATNYVEIDSANTFDKFPQKLLAGQSILLRPQTTTIYAKANTAAVIISVVAAEL